MFQFTTNGVALLYVRNVAVLAPAATVQTREFPLVASLPAPTHANADEDAATGSVKDPAPAAVPTVVMTTFTVQVTAEPSRRHRPVAVYAVRAPVAGVTTGANVVHPPSIAPNAITSRPSDTSHTDDPTRGAAEEKYRTPDTEVVSPPTRTVSVDPESTDMTSACRNRSPGSLVIWLASAATPST